MPESTTRPFVARSVWSVSGVVVCDLPKFLKLVPSEWSKISWCRGVQSVGACRLQCCLGRLLQTKMPGRVWNSKGHSLAPSGTVWSLNRNSSEVQAGTHVKDNEDIRHRLKKTVNDDALAWRCHMLYSKPDNTTLPSLNAVTPASNPNSQICSIRPLASRKGPTDGCLDGGARASTRRSRG